MFHYSKRSSIILYPLSIPTSFFPIFLILLFFIVLFSFLIHFNLLSCACRLLSFSVPFFRSSFVFRLLHSFILSSALHFFFFSSLSFSPCLKFPPVFRFLIFAHFVSSLFTFLPPTSSFSLLYSLQLSSLFLHFSNPFSPAQHRNLLAKSLMSYMQKTQFPWWV